MCRRRRQRSQARTGISEEFCVVLSRGVKAHLKNKGVSGVNASSAFERQLVQTHLPETSLGTPGDIDHVLDFECSDHRSSFSLGTFGEICAFRRVSRNMPHSEVFVVYQCPTKAHVSSKMQPMTPRCSLPQTKSSICKPTHPIAGPNW